MERVMPNERAYEVPVLVVGAGPAGLTTAVALARQGIQVLLVERRQDLSGLPVRRSSSSLPMDDELDVFWQMLGDLHDDIASQQVR
jgi:flavin-dependent dehydrogenase